MSIANVLLQRLTLVVGLMAGCLAMTPALSLAASGTWTKVGGGSWPTTSNWNTLADGSDNTATFSGDIPAGNTWTVTLDGDRTIGNLSFTDTVISSIGSWAVSAGSSGTLTLAVSTGTSTLTVASTTYVNIGAVIAGSGGIVKASNGTLFLSGVNTYTGVTRVNAGTLEVVNANALGATGVGNGTVVGSGRIRIGSDITVDESIDINGAGTTGALNFGSSQSGSNVSTATMGGLVTLASNASIGAGSNNSGILQRTGGGDSINTNGFLLTFTGGGQISVNSPIGGTGSMRHDGSGTIVLAGANTYSGTTAITSNGVLRLGNGGTGGSLPTGSAITLNAANSTFVVDQSDVVTQGVDFSGSAITASTGGAGIGKFTQAGSGTTILNAANSYTGATSVDAGTLFINGNQSSANGAVTVASGATLGGTGTTGGAISILGGGILAPGASAGTLTGNSSLSLVNTSILNFEFNAGDMTVGGGVNDLVTGLTNLTLDGTLNISSLGGDWTNVADFTTWRLFNYTGALTDNTLTIGTVPTMQPWQTFQIDTSTAGQVNVVVVPEPSTCVLLGSAALTGLVVRRRSGPGRSRITLEARRTGRWSLEAARSVE